MKHAAFAAWAVVVLGAYYQRVGRLIADGSLGDWGPADARRALLPFVLLLIAAAGIAASTVKGPRRWRWLGSLAVLAFIVFAGVAAGTRAALFPFAWEAAARALAGLTGAGLVIFAAWSFGGLIALVLDAPNRLERLLFRLAVGMGVIAGVSGALALAHVYTPAAVRVLLGAGLLGGLLQLRRRPGGHPARGEAWPPVQGAERVWLGITALACALALVGALAPETEHDALWYHLWLPQQWLLHGNAFDTVHEYVTLYPLTWELVFGAGLAVGGPTAAKLLHFCCLPLLALVAWQTTRRFFPGASPWLAAAITVSTPTVLWEATTAYVDLALALYVGLGLYALFAWREHGQVRWFAMAGLCLGLGAATKHLALVFVALAAAMIVLDPPAGAARRVRRLLVPAVLVAAALLVASPWYARAWLASGNPFFPELFDLFGSSSPLRWDAVTERGLDGFKSRFGVSRTLGNLAVLPWSVTVHGARFAGSIGPVFLLLLPLVVWAGVRFRDRAASWLAAISIGYLAVWASPLSSFQLRFLVPIVMPLAVLASRSVALARPGEPGRAPGAVTALLALLLLANLPPFTPLHEADRDGFSGWLTHVVREVPFAVVAGHEGADSYLRARVGSYGAWQHLGTHAAPDARVLVGGARLNFYATREALSMEAPAARPAWSQDAAEAAAALERLGVRYVLVERQWMRELRPPPPALTAEEFRRERLHLEYQDNGALLYRVPSLACSFRATAWQASRSPCRRSYGADKRVARLSFGATAWQASHQPPATSYPLIRPASTRSLRITCRTAMSGAYTSSVNAARAALTALLRPRTPARICSTTRSP